jgi:hypothetical protein
VAIKFGLGGNCRIATLLATPLMRNIENLLYSLIRLACNDVDVNLQRVALINLHISFCFSSQSYNLEFLGSEFMLHFKLRTLCKV